MNGFPATHCSVITSRTQGEDAYVLLNTGSTRLRLITFGVLLRGRE